MRSVDCSLGQWLCDLLDLDALRVVDVVIVAHLNDVEDSILRVLQGRTYVVEVVLLKAAEDVFDCLSALRSESLLATIDWLDRHNRSKSAQELVRVLADAVLLL